MKAEISGMLEELKERGKIGTIPKKLRIVTDFSDYFRINYDDVVLLDGVPYLMRHNEKEKRFGIDDEEKFWVKRAVDLRDGSTKIIKMVFHEEFESTIGGLKVHFVRSPGKESRILKKVKNHKNFMQGFQVMDAGDYLIRVIDYIHGQRLDEYIMNLGEDHEDYYYNYFPKILDEFIELAGAIKFLHSRGEIHGDIRRDHVLRENTTGVNKWIDFDYNYIMHGESHFGYDIFSLGNFLLFLVSRGDITLQELERRMPALVNEIATYDLSPIFKHRIVNVKKIYSYISDKLRFILMQFSNGADMFYDSTEQFIDDLNEVEI